MSCGECVWAACVCVCAVKMVFEGWRICWSKPSPPPPPQVTHGETAGSRGGGVAVCVCVCSCMPVCVCVCVCVCVRGVSGWPGPPWNDGSMFFFSSPLDSRVSRFPESPFRDDPPILCLRLSSRTRAWVIDSPDCGLLGYRILQTLETTQRRSRERSVYALLVILPSVGCAPDHDLGVPRETQTTSGSGGRRRDGRVCKLRVYAVFELLHCNAKRLEARTVLMDIDGSRGTKTHSTSISQLWAEVLQPSESDGSTLKTHTHTHTATYTFSTFLIHDTRSPSISPGVMHMHLSLAWSIMAIKAYTF